MMHLRRTVYNEGRRRSKRRDYSIPRGCSHLSKDSTPEGNCKSESSTARLASKNTSRCNVSTVSTLLAGGAVASGISIMVNCEPYPLSGLRSAERFYSSSTARCEPSRPPHDDNKSDSFFDMAQHWALENLPKPSDASEVHNATPNPPNGSDPTNNVQNDNILSGPEQFLKGIGLLGSEDSTLEDKDIDPTIPPDNSKQPAFNFKDTLHTFSRIFQAPANKDMSNKEDPPQQKTKEGEDSTMSEFVSFFFAALSSDKQTSNPDVNELIRQAHNIVNPTPSSMSRGSSSVASTGFLDQILYFKKNKDAIQDAFEASFGKILSSYSVVLSDLFQTMPLATLHYYLENQDSIKTPSWKRRMHRFYSDVEVEKVEELNQALLLSELSYADSVEEVRDGLNRLCGSGDSDDKGTRIADRFKGGSIKPQWELLFCDVESRPNEPSHFLAIQKNSSKYDDTLHVLMVVRGTKSMSDLLTDALLEATDYECFDENGEIIRGKAHSGIVKSGKYLVQRHEKLLSTLVELSSKRKVEINLIGHSLGAGAATMAAIEWNSQKFKRSNENDGNNDNAEGIEVSAHVIGFGCPALLSEPLSAMTEDYVTTVIADADVIPRMSGATLVNLILDLATFDYRKQAERDVEQALRELQYRLAGMKLPTGKSKSKLPFTIDDETIEKVMGYVHRGLEKVVTPGDVEEPGGNNNSGGQKTIKDFQKLEPVLFPPGTCIHFFRDGSGISGTYTPCSFYNEIDVARTMFSDHLISSGYRRIFLNMMRDFHKDDHFSFDNKKHTK
eukprot:CCRYP_000664-RB/>CCRYP_000664-RB protein AED:0.05 eAED:0.05 QI:243/1/1/1/1/1/2/1943/782